MPVTSVGDVDGFPGHTHRAPPQGVRIGRKLLVELVLHQVDEERGEDEDQEADVPGSHQLLQADGTKTHGRPTICLVQFHFRTTGRTDKYIKRKCAFFFFGNIFEHRF